MRKLSFLLAFLIFSSSCSTLSEIESSVQGNITESVDVHVDQTNSSPRAVSLTKTISLNTGEFAQYLNGLTSIKIHSLSYKFKEFTGNSAGTIVNSDLKFDTILVGKMTNLNVSTAATAGTVYSISDPSILAQLEAVFLNKKSLIVSLLADVLSEAGNMDFKIEVSIDITAAYNN